MGAVVADREAHFGGPASHCAAVSLAAADAFSLDVLKATRHGQPKKGPVLRERLIFDWSPRCHLPTRRVRPTNRPGNGVGRISGLILRLISEHPRRTVQP